MFKLQFKLPRDQTPKSRIDSDLFTGGQILTYEFRDMLEAGKVDYKVGAIDKFKEKSVVLTDGTELEADLVVYATGFKKSYDLFDSTFVQPALNIEKDGLYLFRNILPPGVPNLAFVGSEVSTFNNILTHGLQALWLRKLLTGEMELPGSGGMAKIIEKERAWKRSWMPPSSARASIWQLHMMKYHDILMGDMGLNHKRKGNPLTEAFMPYQASDYSDLF
jgi:dimethylaniline monooxygenase (N-oxide forming)